MHVDPHKIKYACSWEYSRLKENMPFLNMLNFLPSNSFVNDPIYGYIVCLKPFDINPRRTPYQARLHHSLHQRFSRKRKKWEKICLGLVSFNSKLCLSTLISVTILGMFIFQKKSRNKCLNLLNRVNMWNAFQKDVIYSVVPLPFLCIFEGAQLQ